MKIAIIGAGNVGSTLGRKWSGAGHEVRFGTRNPADAKFDSLRAYGTVTAIDEALEAVEVVLLSLPGAAIPDFAERYGASLAGKVMIDATNNVRSAEMNNLAILKEKIPGAKLMRAFSTLGWENFETSQLGGEQIDLFYCGSPEARNSAEQLISGVGLRPVYIGDLDTAPALDGMTRLWFALAFGQARGRRIAFKLLEE